MKSPFNFRTGDSRPRLIADTLGFVAFLALCWLGWEILSQPSAWKITIPL